MNESRGGARPFMVFLGVLVLHLVLLAVVLRSSTGNMAAADHSIQLMFLPPLEIPKARSDTIHPQRGRPHVAVGVPTPVLDSSLLSGASSVPEGRGSAVNWAAEAHRAVRAFEIRRDQPPSSAASVSPWDGWWPQGDHRAGDQYKTASGDWIVWIDANCYQVASWHAGAAAVDASQTMTICPAASGKPQGDGADPQVPDPVRPPKE